jgi:hypothetical protein
LLGLRKVGGVLTFFSKQGRQIVENIMQRPIDGQNNPNLGTNGLKDRSQEQAHHYPELRMGYASQLREFPGETQQPGRTKNLQLRDWERQW